MNFSQGNSLQNAHNRLQLRWLLVAISLLLVLTIVVACGSGSGGSSADEPEGASEAAEEDGGGGLPTMPAAKFAAPTTMIDLTKVAETEGEATPEPEAEPDLAFGEEAYGKLCAECHGEKGEGVADKGESIVGLVTEHDAFDDLLRSGGGYGNEHIFGTTKISDDGINSLFAYAQTLTGD